MDSYLKNQDYSEAINHNPWFPLLAGEIKNCKERGNFYSLYKPICNSTPPNFSPLSDASYSILLMKAVTAAFYSISDLQNTPEHKLLPIDLQYKKLLEIYIPKTLESPIRSEKPFTQQFPSAETYGNGKVGYTIFIIKTGSQSKPRYEQLAVTGYKIGESFQLKTNFQFHRGENIVSYIVSRNTSCQLTPLTPLPVTASMMTTTAPTTTILLSITISILVLLCVIIAVKWYRTSKYRFHMNTLGAL